MIESMAVFCLSVHAGYACAHSGACCTAGWTIPIEAPAREGILERGIAPDGAGVRPLFVKTGAETVVATRPSGGCVFYEEARGRLCAVHRLAGPELLPSACRHFPRVVLRDGRGTFVTLSHYCPTAAALLVRPDGARIVEAPPSLALDGKLEGLDATGVLPPLLTRGVLTDLEGYDAWERAGVSVLNRRDLDPDAALDVIGAATSAIVRWRPGGGLLRSAVRLAYDRHADAASAEPDGSAGTLRRFLAAHLFGNWIAYQQQEGIEAVVQYLRDALSLARREAAATGSILEGIRAADLRLRHGVGA
jgi:Fe-S-cluster containining protein